MENSEQGMGVTVGNKLLKQYETDNPKLWDHEHHDLAARSEGYEADWGKLIKPYIKLCSEKYTTELDNTSKEFIRYLQNGQITGSWKVITEHLQWAKDNKLYVWAT